MLYFETKLEESKEEDLNRLVTENLLLDKFDQAVNDKAVTVKVIVKDSIEERKLMFDIRIPLQT